MNDLDSIRQRIRSDEYQGVTSGLAPNHVQGNLVIMEDEYADEFIQYCLKNPKPCPVIGVSKVGDVGIKALGDALDVRIDVPKYHIFHDGKFSRSVSNINDYWADNLVSIVLGCSFSFEDELMKAGLSIRNIDMGVNVSMYETNIKTAETKRFAGNMVVSMRPFKANQIDQVVNITEHFTKAHGAPVHIGDPAGIGVHDLSQPDYGDAVALEQDDIPLFWGCGVTTQIATQNAQLPLVITHAPGKMLITDKTYAELPDLS